jgi:uncharacterized RDD family membrane protein YckC
MKFQRGHALRRWQLIVDCVIFVMVAGVVTLFVAGMGDCGTARDAQDYQACVAFMRWKLFFCLLGTCFIFPFWLGRRLRR